MKKTIALVAVTAAVAYATAGLPNVTSENASVLDGIFSQAQVERGEAIYLVQCASCHGVDLVAPDSSAPSLTGPGFRWGWVNRTLEERKQRIQTTMPLGAGQTLTAQQSLDLVAFILSGNGYPAGDAELTSESLDLATVKIENLQ